MCGFRLLLLCVLFFVLVLLLFLVVRLLVFLRIYFLVLVLLCFLSFFPPARYWVSAVNITSSFVICFFGFCACSIALVRPIRIRVSSFIPIVLSAIAVHKNNNLYILCCFCVVFMFEQNLQNSMFQGNREKTFIDKIFAKDDVNKLQELIKKPKLKREELLELLYLLSSVESKLLNYGEWDRYVILKFFVWVREFVKIAELLYDYRDDLKKRKGFVLSKRAKQLLENNERLIEHNAKFLIDLYLNIGRTTLSLGGTGFLETLKNKYEMAYTSNQNISSINQPNQSTGLFGLGKKGG